MMNWKGLVRRHLPTGTAGTHRISSVPTELGTDILTALKHMKMLPAEFSTGVILVIKQWRGNKMEI
jgi:hypothetical protein